MNDFGAIARARRQELGLLQREVAEMIGCDRQTVEAFEHNQRCVGIDYVLAIYKVLGLRLVVERVKK